MKQRKWFCRLTATAAAMAALLTGGVVASTAMAADRHPIADVGSVTLDKVTDYDGTELSASKTPKSANIAAHLTGVIEHEEQVHEGDVISIPYTVTGVRTIIGVKIDGDVAGADDKPVFTATTNRIDGGHGEILLTATKHAADFTGKETFHLNPQLTLGMNFASRDALFASTTTVSFAFSAKTFAVNPPTNNACAGEGVSIANPQPAFHDLDGYSTTFSVQIDITMTYPFS